MQITFNNVIHRDYTQAIATSLVYPGEVIFRASDGNQYYIDVCKGEVSEAVRGDSELNIRYLEDFEILEFINNNRNRWELDIE